jgi:hypothetical protein
MYLNGPGRRRCFGAATALEEAVGATTALREGFGGWGSGVGGGPGGATGR